MKGRRIGRNMERWRNECCPAHENGAYIGRILLARGMCREHGNRYRYKG